MPVYGDSSIVPDSTFSLSSPPNPQVKRAARTYGRARPTEVPSDASDSSLPYSLNSSGSRDGTYRTAPPDLTEEIPPSSDPAPSNPHLKIGHVDDEDQSSHHDASPGYQFDWRQRLKEMDEEGDEDVQMAGQVVEDTASHPNSGHKRALSPQRPDDNATDHIWTSPAEHDARDADDALLRGPLSSLATSSLASHISFSPSPSPQPTANYKRTRRVVYDSDSEVGEKRGSSPVSPASPHLHTSPKPQSSPTPPTSDDDMPTNPGQSKGKGKAKAPVRPDVPPLRFFEEPSPTNAARTHKTPSKHLPGRKQKKIKPPTKKEMHETARDRMRIAADQRVSIPQAEGSNAKFTISNFFEKIGSTAIQTSYPETDLDPILDFSSDSAAIHVAPSPPILRQTDGSPLRHSPKQNLTRSLEVMPVMTGLDDDSDDAELPDVGTLVAMERVKQESKKQQELLAMKKRLLAGQLTKAPSDDDDDDDDLMVVQSSVKQPLIKREDAERRSGHKPRVSNARKRVLALGGATSATKASSGNSAKSITLNILQAGKKDAKTSLKPHELNRILAAEAHARAEMVNRAKEEEFKQRGGKIKHHDEQGETLSSIKDVNTIYAARRLNLPAGSVGRDSDLEESEEDDEDWIPMERGSASPSPEEGSGGEEQGGSEEQDPVGEDITLVNEEDPTEPAYDEDMEENPPLKSARHSTKKQIVDSDEESEPNDDNVNVSMLQNILTRSPASPGPWVSLLSHRGSLSSMDEPTEDECDKENETSRMWDRGDDKENRAVARHTVINSNVPVSGARKVSIFDLEHSQTSVSPGQDWSNVVNTEDERGDEENRRPFKDLLAEDDPFTSPSRSKFPNSFEAKLKLASPTATLPSTMSLALTPFIGEKALGFSQFPSDEHFDTPGAVPLQPSFSDLFESGTASFNQPSSRLDEAVPSKGSHPSNLSLTQDLTLQPAFEVNEDLLRKADQIFEKEQEYVLETANKKTYNEPELYVNDHGFLTQTRPNVASPDIYRPSPTQATATDRQFQPQSSLRRPLRTISLSEETDFDSPAMPNRLHKRTWTPTSPLLTPGYKSSPSPAPVTNAFDAIMKRPAKTDSEKSKQKRIQSEYLLDEAEESSDDEMFGFGLRQKADDDGEDGEDLDKTLETLVDDNEMDEKTQAAELVLEKFKEQEEVADRENEKLHQAAVQGDLRRKRRNRGVGMEDSDDESDEDEANRRIRRNMYKKQRIDRDNIKELGQSEETRSFYNTYTHDLNHDDENDFSYLEESQTQDIIMNDEEGVNEEEPREVVTATEIRERLKEIVQKPYEDEEEPLDPCDVSWIDDDQSDGDHNLRVKQAHPKARQPQVTRRRGVDTQIEDLMDLEMPPPKTVMAEGSINRMQSWAKGEGRSRHIGNTGRNVGGAAVTGHRVKAGGGSLRNTSAGSSGLATSNKPSEQRRPLKAQPSVLASVAAERRNTGFA